MLKKGGSSRDLLKRKNEEYQENLKLFSINLDKIVKRCILKNFKTALTKIKQHKSLRVCKFENLINKINLKNSFKKFKAIIKKI